MKKILLILISIPLIFSSCEKEEEDNNNNNNNNNITDVIVGDWVKFAYECPSGTFSWENPYDEEIERHLNFLSDGTLEDYRIINGVKENGIFGTWENIGNGQYDLRVNENGNIIQETTTPIFYCVESVFQYSFDNDPGCTNFWQKNTYDFRGCSEVKDVLGYTE